MKPTNNWYLWRLLNFIVGSFLGVCLLFILAFFNLRIGACVQAGTFFDTEWFLTLLPCVSLQPRTFAITQNLRRLWLTLRTTSNFIRSIIKIWIHVLFWLKVGYVRFSAGLVDIKSIICRALKLRRVYVFQGHFRRTGLSCRTVLIEDGISCLLVLPLLLSPILFRIILPLLMHLQPLLWARAHLVYTLLVCALNSLARRLRV